MGIMDEFFSMGLALKTQFVRMGRHRVFADLAQELDLNLKYPAHIFGDVGDVWIAVRIDMQKNGDAPAMIWVESSPNCPLPNKIEPEFLEDVISNVKADKTEIRHLIDKLVSRAEKVRKKYQEENPEPEEGFSWGGLD